MTLRKTRCLIVNVHLSLQHRQFSIALYYFCNFALEDLALHPCGHAIFPLSCNLMAHSLEMQLLFETEMGRVPNGILHLMKEWLPSWPKTCWLNLIGVLRLELTSFVANKHTKVWWSRPLLMGLALWEMLQLYKKSSHVTFGLWSVRLNAALSFPWDAWTPWGPCAKRLPPRHSALLEHPTG